MANKLTRDVQWDPPCASFVCGTVAHTAHARPLNTRVHNVPGLS